MPMDQHPGQTVRWGGAHSACAVVAPFCNLHLEGLLGRRGGSSNSRGQRQLLRLCVTWVSWSLSGCDSVLVEMQAPGWLTTDSAAEGPGFVHTQLPLSAIEGPSPESHPLLHLALSHASRRWMIWARRPRLVSQKVKSLEGLSELKFSIVPVSSVPSLDILLSGNILAKVT